MEAAVRAYAAADAVIKPAVFQTVRRFLFALPAEAASPTAGLPFVDSPTPLLLFLGGYLLVVGAGLALSPRAAAAKRPDPAWLRLLVLVHNVFLVALSLGMFLGISYCAATRFGSLWGNEYDASHTALARLIYVFYVSKIYEFMDTFIMLLKGNLQQVSLLHVYHHASISCIWWVIAYVAPGGDAYFSAALNSLVHVLMYTYYLMAILIGRDAKAARDKYLFWGKYLTMFQMAQFVANLVQAAYCWRFSPYPRELSSLLFGYMITLLALFAMFFHGKHVAPKKAGGRAKKQH